LSQLEAIIKPIRLGILFDTVNSGGGGFQQALNAVLLVNKLPKNLVDPIIFTHKKENIDFLKEHGFSAQYVSRTSLGRVFLFLRRKIRHPRIYVWFRKLLGTNHFEKILLENKVDLVYFLTSTPIASELENLNYITTVWDLSHRDCVEFPEVRSGRIFERREQNFHDILPKATAILADSELLKNNIMHRYGIDESRIYIMPFSAAKVISDSKGISNIDIRKKYQLETPYIYYPAQFWSHKNHIYLLKGIKVLENKFNKKISVIFTGSDQGSLSHVKNFSKDLDLANRVIFAGFVSDYELVDLYKQSLALVMPTYFGPTNIPPLEAFSLGVPVLYSKIEGLIDQVGDAALLMDLEDPMSMATHLNNLIDNDNLRNSLISNGFSLIAELSDEKRLKTLEDILKSYQSRRLCWE
jgi:glycosyltransferase involved in cell wall biosynthesis